MQYIAYAFWRTCKNLPVHKKALYQYRICCDILEVRYIAYAICVVKNMFGCVLWARFTVAKDIIRLNPGIENYSTCNLIITYIIP